MALRKRRRTLQGRNESGCVGTFARCGNLENSRSETQDYLGCYGPRRWLDHRLQPHSTPARQATAIDNISTNQKTRYRFDWIKLMAFSNVWLRSFVLALALR